MKKSNKSVQLMSVTKLVRGTVVERRSLTGELSLSHARLAADGWPLSWVNHPLQVSQPGQLSLSSFRHAVHPLTQHAAHNSPRQTHRQTKNCFWLSNSTRFLSLVHIRYISFLIIHYPSLFHSHKSTNHSFYRLFSFLKSDSAVFRLPLVLQKCSLFCF